MSGILILVLLAIMVALNALYVAAEFATVGSRRSRVQASAEGGNRSASWLLGVMQDPIALDNYVAACQVGITLSSLVAGAYGQAQLTPILEEWLGSSARVVAIIITLIFITSLQVVLGELLPKTAALRYPERIAIGTVAPMRISRWLFRPLVAIFNGSAFALMRRLGLHHEHSHAHVHSPEELAGLFDESAKGGLIDASERDMVAGVLNVEHRLVREIMTPRRRVVGVGRDKTVREAFDSVVDTPHSRFVVWGDSDDEAVGLVHLRDLYLKAQTAPDAVVATVSREVPIVAETMPVPELWQLLRDREKHCAVIVNEYGVTAGLVTVEDAIEEIVGEVRDEFDTDPDPIVIENGRVSVNGEVLLEDIDRRFGVDLKSDDVDTIGGLVWHELGRVPDVGETVPLSNGDDLFDVRIDAVDANAIERVSFTDPEASS